MTSLFRSEVIEARRDTWLGSVQLSQPLPVRIVAWSCALMIVASGLVLGLCSYTRRVHASGQVVPAGGVLTVAASQPGTIAVLKVREGQHVRKGDVLFIENLEVMSAAGPMQKQVLSDLLRQKNILEQQRKLRETSAPIERQAIASELQYLARQRDQVSAQIDDQERVLPLVQSAFERLRQAQGRHLVTESQFQAQLSSYSQLLGAHAQSLQSRTEIDGKLADLGSRLARFDTDLHRDLNDLDRQIAGMDQQMAESEGRRSNLIVAPEDGVLTGVRGYLGEQVSPGVPLVTLLPKGESLKIELYVDSGAIGFLREGEPVLLRYAAFPYQKFGLHKGHIEEITHAPLSTGGQTLEAQGNGGGEGAGQQHTPSDIFRIRVVPDETFVRANGIPHPLGAGMAVSADIATDSRRLWQWMLDPVVSFRDTLNTTMGTH